MIIFWVYLLIKCIVKINCIMFINILLATIKFKIIYIGYISMRQYWSKSFLQKEQWKQNITDTMIEVYVPWEELLWVWITRSISITWELARNRDSWIPIPNLLNQELREQTRQCVCVCVCVCMCMCFKKPPGDSNFTKFWKVLPKGNAEESVTCSIGGGDYVIHRIIMEKM